MGLNESICTCGRCSLVVAVSLHDTCCAVSYLIHSLIHAWISVLVGGLECAVFGVLHDGEHWLQSPS